jgi:flagellar biosynthesis/type III secretory pathway M-ring protein FliF/YscJ
VEDIEKYKAAVEAASNAGIAVLFFIAVLYIVVKHLIPASQKRAEASDLFLRELYNQQRADFKEASQRDHDFYQGLLSENNKQLKRLCGILVAHDIRCNGGTAEDIYSLAEEMTGEDFSEGKGKQ